jgi:hypothetical protein
MDKRMTASRRLVTGLRWLLVPVAAYGGFLLALALAILGFQGLSRFCPPDDMVSGLCMAWWFEDLLLALETVGGMLAAALVVLAGSLTAPAHRPLVAAVLFVLGGLAAFYLGWPPRPLVLVASATGGLLAVALVYRRWRA